MQMLRFAQHDIPFFHRFFLRSAAFLRRRDKPGTPKPGVRACYLLRSRIAVDFSRKARI